MRLNEFGEKDFIRTVLGPAATTARNDLFDDAVVIDLAELTSCADAPYLVYSIDQPSFVRHSDESIDPYRFYGRWVAGATCNDVIAMGARCRGFSVALSAPGETEVADVSSFVQGLGDVLDLCGATYEGGNFDKSELTTVGYAWGTVPRQGLVRRAGARVGDAIVVTGQLGLGWLEYQLRKHELTDRIAPDHRRTFVRYKQMPVGAAAAIADVAERGWFSSGMDLSDGVVEFLHNIASRTAGGCLVELDALPVSAATIDNLALLFEIEPMLSKVLHERPQLVALEPGYDSPLVHAFTIGRDHVDDAQRVFRTHGESLHIVGEVTEHAGVGLRSGRDVREVPAFWDDQMRESSLFGDWVEFLSTLA